MQIPFFTVYMCYLLNEWNGIFCGGKDTDYTTWISGVLQQNENVGVPFRLAEYGELTGLKLTYGKAPEGLTHSHSGISEHLIINPSNPSDMSVTRNEVNAGADPIALSGGGAITAIPGENMTQGAPKERTYENKYVVRIKTADIKTAGTTNPITVSLSYTTTAGETVTTSPAEIASLAEAFYGRSHRSVSSTYQYERHMRRSYTGEEVAYVKQSVLLYQNSPSKTVYFTVFDENGEPIEPEVEASAENTYLTTIPDAMTYEETRKTLGLAVSKYTYTVDVKVADVEDAGSGNYFYFQLVFANGTSGVVLANLNGLVLSNNNLTGAAGAQPIISHAIIERVKGNVIVEVYRAEFANQQVVTSIESSISGQTAGNCSQVVRLQLAPSQRAPLTAETNDVAVALRYTSSLDLGNKGKIYQSPYCYLTDAGLTSVATGAPIELAFDVDGVGEIVGLAVISSGPTVTVDRAAVDNYSGDPASNTPASRLSSCYLNDRFTTSSMGITLDGGEETVVPAAFTFTVPEEAVAPGGGSSGSLSMTVRCQDNGGEQGVTAFLDLASYLPAGTPGFAAGSKNTINVLLPDAAVLTGVTLSTADDSWFLSEMSAQLTLPTGQVISGGTTVNNWARPDQSLESLPDGVFG